MLNDEALRKIADRRGMQKRSRDIQSRRSSITKLESSEVTEGSSFFQNTLQFEQE